MEDRRKGGRPFHQTVMVVVSKMAFIDKENYNNMMLRSTVKRSLRATVIITAFLLRLVPALVQLPCPTSFGSPDPATLLPLFLACISHCTPQALDDPTQNNQGV
jgi:hypothetical protein